MPYIITRNTLALLSIAKKTKIIEYTTTKEFEIDSASIVAKNCIINGSTLEGRQKASSYLIGTSYKPPILINDKVNLILIPTHSIRNKDCNWLVLSNILNYYPTKTKGVIVEFKNNEKILLDVSFAVFDKQVLRATRLESALRGRNNKKYL